MIQCYAARLDTSFVALLDAFHDPGAENIYGGEYAPGLIEQFTTGDSVNTQIYFTMSTWNHYQTIVMKSEIGAPEVPLPPVSTTETLVLGDATWSKTNTTFYTRTSVGNKPGAMTWAAEGDASTVS